jgi:chemotaxis protein CheD
MNPVTRTTGDTRTGAGAPRCTVGNCLDTTGTVDGAPAEGPTVFLRPGDWLFARGPHRVHTLLGSCVSLVLWVPRLRLGGMCHYLLPTRPSRLSNGRLDGRFGEEACAWMETRLRAAGVPWHEVETSVAGGAGRADDGIGADNIAWAQAWGQARSLRFAQQDVGGRVVRRLVFNLNDGSLAIAHGGRLDEGMR